MDLSTDCKDVRVGLEFRLLFRKLYILPFSSFFFVLLASRI
jgi:hypothetical protein